MPWSCLCSSEKEKHKLQISAPILNRNDKRNVKIIQNSSNIRKEETVNSDYQRNVNDISSVSSKNYPDDDKLRLKSSLKKKVRLKKNDKNAKDSQALLYGGKEQSPRPAVNVKFSTCTADLNSNVSSSSPYRAEPEDEDSTYSQLVFECKTNKPNEPSVVNVFPPNTSASIPQNDAVEVKDPNTGHYDVLPFEKSSKQNVSGDIDLKNANVKDKVVGQQWSGTKSHGQPFYQGTSTSAVTGGNFCNGDVIPFIDEDDTLNSVERHGTQQRVLEGNDSSYTNKSRIITLHPLNVGSSQTIQRGDSLFRTHLSNSNTISNKSEVSTTQLKPQQQTHVAMNLIRKINENVEIRQTSPQTSATAMTSPIANVIGKNVDVHEFFSWNSTKGKLCQICHVSTLNGSNMLKCRGCGLVCHIWCVPTIMVSG